MFTTELTTSNPAVTLVKPNAERDAPLAVQWLAGPAGRHTLRLMGVSDEDNQPTTLEREQQRIQDFLDHTRQYNWIIQAQGSVVGAIWVDLEPSTEISAPAVSIMLGAPNAREQGIGQAALGAVIAYLQTQGQDRLYARHTTENTASAGLLESLGFLPDGPVYTSSADRLSWQNLSLTLNLVGQNR